MAKADVDACLIKTALEGYFRRWELAGSIRRRRELVGDIDVVVDVEPTRVAGLMDHLHRLAMQAGGKVENIGGGWKCPVMVGDRRWDLNLFTANPETWAITMVIRTGPAEFNKALCGRAKGLGYHIHPVAGHYTPGLYAGPSHDGGNGCSGQRFETPDERDVFLALGMTYVEPWMRGWDEPGNV